MARFGQPSVSQIIAKVAENDSKFESIDFSSQAVFQMKSVEKIQELSDALKSNTKVTVVKLKDCGIDDAGAAMLGDMLAKNSTITELDLSQNTAIKEEGAIALANGLAKNTGIVQLDLMGMPLLGKSERTLVAFTAMYATNLTLKKIVWRLDHPLANTLAKLATRNNSIARRKEQGKDFDDLLPDALRAGKSSDGTAPAAAGDSSKAQDAAAAVPAATEKAPAQQEKREAPAQQEPPSAAAVAPEATPTPAPETAAKEAEPEVPATSETEEDSETAGASELIQAGGPC